MTMLPPDTLCEQYLQSIQNHGSDDPIHQCDDVDLSQLLEATEQLFSIADEKLHVYPFKDVKPCWFRLYTDTSLVRALKLAISSRSYGSHDGHFDKFVQILDMALIMAGGLGREEVIRELLGQNTLLRSPNDVSLPHKMVSMPRVQSPVQSATRPSLMDFQKHMYHKKQPLILIDTLEHWSALKKWQSIDYWLYTTLEGRRLVPIEVGRSYVDDDWGQKIVTFKDFLENYILSLGQTGYLAQHDLLKQIPALREDIAIPDYCYLDTPTLQQDNQAMSKGKTSHPTTIPVVDEGTNIHTNIWFGPSWTISPLHHDPYHNILCQVVGKKYVRLYSPKHSQKLFPRGEIPAPHDNSATIDMSNTSTIDIAAIELSPQEDWDEVYPGISEVPYVDYILEAGQALYIPVGWWHYVRSISVGISVSFWWN